MVDGDGESERHVVSEGKKKGWILSDWFLSPTPQLPTLAVAKNK
jgi:hypothetical protein